jgi:Cohesin domain
MKKRTLGQRSEAELAEALEGFLPDPSESVPSRSKASKDQRAAKLSALLLAISGVGAHVAARAEDIGYGGPAELSIVPEESSVQVGSSITADVSFSNLNNTLIGAYDLTIDYNPSLLSISSVTYNTYLDGPLNSIQGSNSSLGALEVYEVSLGSLANQSGFGTVPLFDITFNSLAAGTSALSFDTVANGGATISDQNGNAFTNYTLVNSSVSITSPVGPPPTQAPEIDSSAAGAAVTLLLGGLLVSSAGRRKKADD